MTRRQVAVLVLGVILLVVAVTRGLAVRTTSTGPLVWTAALNEFPQSIVVDAQTHRAFITTISFGVGSARRNVLDTDIGAILRRMVIGGKGYPPPVLAERAGRVVVAASLQVRFGPGVAGIVRVLDAHSGDLVRAVTVGLFPQGVAVDEPKWHVFVINGPGYVILPDRWAWLPAWLRRRLPFLSPPGRQSHFVPGGVSMVDPTR